LKTICSTCIAVFFYLGAIYVLSFIFQGLQISNSLLEVFGFFSDLVEIDRHIYRLT